MINVACKACGCVVRITGEPNDVALFADWWPDHFPCPKCKQAAEVVDAISPDTLPALSIYDLTSGEAFQAFNGLGFPEERECGPIAVRMAFQQAVETVNTRLIKGTTRAVIDSIKFADGTTMYLGASSYGAIVYRISGP